MKTAMLLIPILLSNASFSQDLYREFDAAGIKYLLVANIQGTVKVTGANVKNIAIHATQTIKKKTAGSDPKVDFLQQGDTLAIYIASECSQFSLRKPCEDDEVSWGYYNWHECQKETSLKVDFNLVVPSELFVILSTINDGDIMVENIKAPIWANNINGKVLLEQVASILTARTINGDVTIKFKENPKDRASFYTLNGNITAYFQPDLQADISFKTFQGNFFTDFENATTAPFKIEVSESKNGFIYKLDGRSNIRINRGGINLDFETFNGNVYLRTI
jgi:DUF4097 and DUF4098 domain-containing protein YvlB